MQISSSWRLPAILLVVLASSACIQLGEDAPPHNIILVLADDVSAKEYSSYGGDQISTPFLDRLAEEGKSNSFGARAAPSPL